MCSTAFAYGTTLFHFILFRFQSISSHLSNENRWSGALTRAPLPRSRELPSRVMTTDNPPLRQDNGPTCTRGEPHFRHAWSRNVNNRVPIDGNAMALPAILPWALGEHMSTRGASQTPIPSWPLIWNISGKSRCGYPMATTRSDGSMNLFFSTSHKSVECVDIANSGWPRRHFRGRLAGFESRSATRKRGHRRKYSANRTR